MKTLKLRFIGEPRNTSWVKLELPDKQYDCFVEDYVKANYVKDYMVFSPRNYFGPVMVNMRNVSMVVFDPETRKECL